MNRASPVDLRKALETAGVYANADILFVPMPVLNEADHHDLVQQASQRIEQIIAETESEQPD